MAYLATNKKIRAKGFSLVEMAVVLAIVGLLSMGTMYMFSEQKNQAEWQESQAKLKVVKLAILNFAQLNKYMPCPDNATGSTGRELRTDTTGTIPAVAEVTAVAGVLATAHSPAMPAVKKVNAQAEIPGVPVSVCSVNVGTVPYVTLGLSKADVADSWGHPFIYAVDQGVTNANNMLDCPTNTACFFNKNPKPDLSVLAPGKVFPGSVLPAYSSNTQPLKDGLGANNLEICADTACSKVQAQGLVAVLLATNDDGFSAPSVSDGEVQNLKGEKIYVNQTYSKAPFYDDVVVGISGYDVLGSKEGRVLNNVVIYTTDENEPIVKTTNDVRSIGDGSFGNKGSNIGTDQGVLEQTSKEFDFGEERAGEKVVINLNTHAVGGWNKAASEEDANVFDDRGAITANGETLKEFDYDRLTDPWDGLEQVTFTSAIDGRYKDIYKADGTWDDRSFTVGQQVTTWVPYWNESHEYVVILDENGRVNLGFEVQTTSTAETIDFTDISVTYFDTPADMPDFPTVDPIEGIDQTEGLNNDE